MGEVFSYLADQDKILLGKNGKNELTLYLDGLGIDEHLGQLGPRGVTAYITDHLGTVINGEALGQKRATAAFGESLLATSMANGGDNHAKGTAISTTSDPAQYGFAGRTLDRESGLHYNRARSYDPSTGRFMTTDPIFPQSGTNPYAYTRNNPLRYVDPTGLSCRTAWEDFLWYRSHKWDAIWGDRPPEHEPPPETPPVEDGGSGDSPGDGGLGGPDTGTPAPSTPPANPSQAPNPPVTPPSAPNPPVQPPIQPPPPAPPVPPSEPDPWSGPGNAPDFGNGNGHGPQAQPGDF